MNETPDVIFSALHAAAQLGVGVRLFTVTVLDRRASLARRAYSSHPVDYPVSGTKPMSEDGWSRIVIDQGRSFVANATREFSPYFPDHPLINTLGCHSAMNIPISDGSKVVGTVNLLDVEGHFTPDRIARLEALVAAHRLDLLAAIRATPMPSQVGAVQIRLA